MNAKYLTYEQGYSDGYKTATEHYQKIIQELAKMQPPQGYIIVTKERFEELKKEGKKE